MTTIAATDLELGLALYETMLRIRRFEERVGELFAAGELPGFVHLSIGQESVAAGVIATLRPTDTITATHRGHGQIIAKGGRFEPMMAELFGRATGYCKGKGGSMHLFDLSLGILGANGILGAGQPIAVGAALSAKLRGTDEVTVTFFGEGASAQGAVHEAMNLAGVWRAPIVFVAEINGWAELTPYDVHVSVSSIADRGAAYGIASVALDATDVFEVHAAAEAAVERARAGGGPSLIEARTVRWHGHYEGDPQRYRDSDELAALTDRDPLTLLAARLREAGVEESRLDGLDAAAGAELDEAVEFARSSPFPEESETLTDVYGGE
jgi:TPP-dependent pyruvate/acetoin dehydrogenase alpha subunit